MNHWKLELDDGIIPLAHISSWQYHIFSSSNRTRCVTFDQFTLANTTDWILRWHGCIAATAAVTAHSLSLSLFQHWQTKHSPISFKLVIYIFSQLSILINETQHRWIFHYQPLTSWLCVCVVALCARANIGQPQIMCTRSRVVALNQIIQIYSNKQLFFSLALSVHVSAKYVCVCGLCCHL